jgi:hypothetical protein
MTTRGINLVQTTSRILLDVSLKDADGAKVTTGTTEVRVYRREDDNTLDVLDWTTWDFVAAGSGTPDDEGTLTHVQRRDSSGADVDTGLWLGSITTLTNFTVGQKYIVAITNSNAVPETQERMFQFGGVEGDQTLGDASGRGDTSKFSGNAVQIDSVAGLNVPIVSSIERAIYAAGDTLYSQMVVRQAKFAAFVQVMDGTGVLKNASLGPDIFVASNFHSDVGEEFATAASELLSEGIPAALLDLVNGIEDGLTPRQAARLILAAASGKRSGMGTSAEQYDAAGSPGTARIVIDADEDGNGTPTLTP